jgi:hypothetical protein
VHRSGLIKQEAPSPLVTRSASQIVVVRGAHEELLTWRL